MQNEKTIALRFIDENASQADRELLTPKKGSDDAAGFDLVASHHLRLEAGTFDIVRTGIAIELPKGHEAQVRPRSGLARKYGVTVLNSPGTIDADYRGEVGVLLINHGQRAFEIERGMRIAQLVVAQVSPCRFIEMAISQSKRGEGGFGSTGMR